MGSDTRFKFRKSIDNQLSRASYGMKILDYMRKFFGVDLTLAQDKSGAVQQVANSVIDKDDEGAKELSKKL